MSVDSKKKYLEDLITVEIKNRIKQLKLIKTGKMLDSIKSNIVFNSDGYFVDITSTDYFDELDYKYNMINYVLALPKVSNGIADLFAEILIDKSFN